MKRMNYIFQIGCFLVSILVLSCDDQEFGELGESRDKVGPTAGVYSLQKLTQIEGLIEFVVSDVADFSDFSLTLNATGGAPETYEITTGMVPLKVSATGNWAFDNQDRPSEIIFNQGESTIQLTAPPLGFDNQLQVSFEPGCNGIIYSLVLEKQ